MKLFTCLLLVGVCASQVFAAPGAPAERKDLATILLERAAARAEAIAKRIEDSGVIDKAIAGAEAIGKKIEETGVIDKAVAGAEALAKRVEQTGVIDKAKQTAGQLYKKVEDTGIIGKAQAEAGKVYKTIDDTGILNKAKEQANAVINSPIAELVRQRTHQVMEKVGESKLGEALAAKAEPYIQAAAKSGCALAKSANADGLKLPTDYHCQEEENA
ncbi:uncharacterized protein [Diabrotica undecimpunctata]|uniref:uncharacterized protein n=1 Tax=Diabrotica undecimpunctata TaxID=50387 RepID=UPI003B632E93